MCIHVDCTAAHLCMVMAWTGVHQCAPVQVTCTLGQLTGMPERVHVQLTGVFESAPV
jgi:hypothetical protein